MRVTHESHISTKTLKEFLEFNIDYIRNAVKTLSPGADLQPTIVFESADGDLNFIVLGLNDKNAEIAEARRILHAKGAQMYAMITAAWALKINNLKTQQGQLLEEAARRIGLSHPLMEPYRREIYAVSVGDKNGTLLTNLEVVRDRDGRIIDLIRDQSDSSEAIVTGRMMDLLAEPPPP